MLWSPRLPDGFKRFCAQVSLDTSAIQYENDDLIRPAYDDDTAIACCVSAMRVGKDMQFFGARANLAKALLYAINGGRDELTGEQVAPATPPVDGDVLDYDEVLAAYDRTLDWLAETYVDALNVIHHMHDRYAYERLEMALHDHPVRRFMATGIAGLSVAVDSLVGDPVRARSRCCATTPGWPSTTRSRASYPTYGNNDDRADAIAVGLVRDVHGEAAPAAHLPRRRARPCRCSPSPRTWSTASTPATPPTAAGPASRSRRAPTR